jgi:pimeloyl-ACP methyl ester carboxylesterase
VRQSQVAALGRLVLALLLVLPLLGAARSAVLAAAFLTEFLTAGGWRPLSVLTYDPTRVTMSLATGEADRHLPAAGVGRPLVLVHGLTPDGKDDQRLAASAALLSRLGFDVAVPTIPGLTQWRLRPEDREPVVAAIAARSEPSVIVGVSVGAGVAMLAAADARVRGRAVAIVSLGGYASAFELARYYLTGQYGDHGVRGRVVHDPELIRTFLAANEDLLDVSAQRVLAATSPGDVEQALARLSPELRSLFEALSPERAVEQIRAPMILVHGRGDIAVPYTESVRLARARPAGTRIVLVGAVAHVERAPVGSSAASLRDLALLWAVVYGLARQA